MGLLSKFNIEDLTKLQEEIRKKKPSYACFEDAAQDIINSFQQIYKDSVVLARVFATVPYSNLPADNKKFVDSLSVNANIAQLIRNDTLVLSLIGTAGFEKEWRDRKNSKGHIGIPLASGAFIDAIPMMSRLLKQLGLDFNWINRNDVDLVKSSVGKMTGMFYVKDAKTEIDMQGRKIIAAQDFVKKYDVKTVFGFGGGYFGTNLFYTTIIFLNEELDQVKARLISAGLAFFKIITMDLVDSSIFK